MKFCAGQLPFDHGSKLEERPQIDSGRKAHGLEHEHEVFSADIAGRTRRVGATTESPERGVKHRNPAFNPRKHVREPEPARVVKVQRSESAANLTAYCLY